MSKTRRSLRRSLDRRWIAGVCAGVADYMGWDRRLVRCLWLIGTVIPILPGLPLYLAIWIFVRAE